MKNKEKTDKNKAVENQDFFLSEFDALGGYTGNNFMNGYEPEQDADDI